MPHGFNEVTFRIEPDTQPVDEEINIKKIVRKFSYDIAAKKPEDPLSQAVAKSAAQHDPNAHLQTSLAANWIDLSKPSEQPDFLTNLVRTSLEKGYQDLWNTWREFQKCLPETERVAPDVKPDVNAVYEAVRAAERQLKVKSTESVRGKMSAVFQRVCSSLVAHRDLFAVIPRGDKYFSIVAGSLTAIVKVNFHWIHLKACGDIDEKPRATVNYGEIASALSNALDDLTSDVNRWKRRFLPHRHNYHMQELIIQVYVVIFEFLTDIMTTWYSSKLKRLKASLNSDFLVKHIKSKTDKLAILEKKLVDESLMETQHEVSNLPAKIEDIVEAKLAAFASQLVQAIEKMGKSGQTMLYDQLRYHPMYGHGPWDLHNSDSSGPSIFLAPHSPPSLAVKRYNIQEIVSHCAHLQTRVQEETVNMLFERTTYMRIEQHLFDAIQQWSTNRVSEALWLQGNYGHEKPTQITLTGASVALIAMQAQIPVACFFCYQTAESILDSGPGSDDKELVNLIYSLIHQVVSQISEDFSSELDLSAQRFKLLDGSSASLMESISLLADLIAVGPPLLFCLVDGLQDLEHRVTSKDHLLQIIQILQGQHGGSGSRVRNVVKTLFTTDGFCDVLDEAGGITEFDTSYSGRGNQTGAHARIGGREIGFLMM